MKNFFVFFFFVGFCMCARPEVDADTKAAVTSTQEIMRDKSEREKILAKDKKAKEADDFVTKAADGNPTQKDELYNLSAEILPWVMEQAGGDPEKANQILQEALKNPAEFVKRLPASHREKIESVAAKKRLNKKQP